MYKAVDNKSGAVVAIKVIPCDSDLSEFKREIDILAHCTSPYVVSYLGAYAFDGDLWIGAWRVACGAWRVARGGRCCRVRAGTHTPLLNLL